MHRGRFLLLLGIAFLSACGGGGGGGGSASGGGAGDGSTLNVALSWPESNLDLFKAATVLPVFSGFDGHAPNCTLVLGQPPAGMTLQSNCSIVGRPTEAGESFNFSVRVGASGVSNTVNSGVTLRVRAPTVTYAWHAGPLDNLVLGTIVNDRPSITGWTAPADLPLAWTYSVVAGSLPPGLVLDAGTGAVTGTVGAAGSFHATLRVLLKTARGEYEATSAYSANVNVASFSYLNTGGTGLSNLNQAAYVSQPFKLEPFLDARAPAGSTLSDFSVSGPALPAGVTIDAATGIISGRPTKAGGAQSATILAIITSPNGGVPTQSFFSGIEVFDPVYVRYPISSIPLGAVGVPLIVNPEKVQLSPLPLVSPTFYYTPRAGQCDLPPGISFNSATGIASGTPTMAGSFSCFIDMTITNDGLSWDTASQLFAVIQ